MTNTRTKLSPFETLAIEHALKHAIKQGLINFADGEALLDKIQDSKRITITRGGRAEAWSA